MIVITGGAGFIGSNLVKFLNDNDEKNILVVEELDSYVSPELSILDHSVLNEVDGLETPTSENIAKWLWEKLKKKISNLRSIEINRPRIGGCIYSGD